MQRNGGGKETVMEQEQRQAAKREMLELMQAGQPWQTAAAAAGIQVSRSTAYRWQQEVRTRGEAALQDGRQGHPAKVLPSVLHWLESRCQATSLVPSSQLQRELQEQLECRSRNAKERSTERKWSFLGACFLEDRSRKP